MAAALELEIEDLDISGSSARVTRLSYSIGSHRSRYTVWRGFRNFGEIFRATETLFELGTGGCREFKERRWVQLDSAHAFGVKIGNYTANL